MIQGWIKASSGVNLSFGSSLRHFSKKSKKESLPSSSKASLKDRDLQNFFSSITVKLWSPLDSILKYSLSLSETNYLNKSGSNSKNSVDLFPLFSS